MNIKKYSRTHPNYDLCGDGIYSTYKVKSRDKSYCRYWTKQMLKKVYGLRVKYTKEE